MVYLPDEGRGEAGYLESMLSNFSASYKIFWFKGIFELVLEGKNEIPFSDITSRMIASAWYPILFYNLNLGKIDELGNAVKYIEQTFNVSKEAKFKDIIKFLGTSNSPELISRLKSFENYVPYRLIRPFFDKEIKGLKDLTCNKEIAQLSRVSEKVFYSINPANNSITVNQSWIDYLKRNEVLVKGWLNYKLVDYLQKRNPNVPAIPHKIFPPETRDLKEATCIWKKLLKYEHITDIYSGLVFTPENEEKYGRMSIDHFIPWSFVLHDELWNLCPTFKNINSKKSNRIPQVKYIDKFCELQYFAFLFAKENFTNRNLESYLTIKNDVFEIQREQDIGRNVFEKAIKDTISPLHQIAYNQGYELWEYGK